MRAQVSTYILVMESGGSEDRLPAADGASTPLGLSPPPADVASPVLIPDAPAAYPSISDLPDVPGAHTGGGAMVEAMAAMERRFEQLLEGFSEEMAAEVEREQSHLMLMQDQVNQQRETLTRQIQEVQKKLVAEEQQRSYVQRTVQDSNEQLRDLIAAQGEELRELRATVARLEAAGGAAGVRSPGWGAAGEAAALGSPQGNGGQWLSSMTGGVWGMFSACAPVTGPMEPPRREEYATITKVASSS